MCRWLCGGPGRQWRGQEQRLWCLLCQAGLHASLDSSPVPIPGSKPPSSIHSSRKFGIIPPLISPHSPPSCLALTSSCYISHSSRGQHPRMVVPDPPGAASWLGGVQAALGRANHSSGFFSNSSYVSSPGAVGWLLKGRCTGRIRSFCGTLERARAENVMHWQKGGVELGGGMLGGERRRLASSWEVWTIILLLSSHS